MREFVGDRKIESNFDNLLVVFGIFDDLKIGGGTSTKWFISKEKKKPIFFLLKINFDNKKKIYHQRLVEEMLCVSCWETEEGFIRSCTNG